MSSRNKLCVGRQAAITFGPRHDRSLALHLRAIGRTPLLSIAEEYAVAVQARNGDAGAREKLVLANLRFVVAVAKQYQHRGLALVDLIAEGNRGLLEAVDRFDPARGFRFISHAVWWVRRPMLAALTDHGRIIRLPGKRVQQLRQLRAAKTKLAQQLEREPALHEIAECAGIESDLIMQLLEVDAYPIGLDTPHPITQDRVSEGLAAADAIPTDGSAEQHSAHRALERALHALPMQDQQVLRRYYGLDGEAEPSLRAIGDALGISSERVRQIRDRALQRLRTNGHLTDIP